MYHFDSISYFTGVLTGMIIRWTDIIPIFGGFLLGISIKKLPEFVDLTTLPINLTDFISFLKMKNINRKDPKEIETDTMPIIENSSSQVKIPIIKKKK